MAAPSSVPLPGTTPPAITPSSSRGTVIVARPVRHPWRTFGAIVVVALIASLLYTFASSPNMDWATVGEYLFADLTFRGLGVTLLLTAVSMVIGIVGGTLVAVMRLSENYVLRSVAVGYIWFFRGTPVLVQIIFWGFLGAFFPLIQFGIPFTDITFFSRPTGALISSTTAAILALGLNEIAYAAEIVRSGIQSIGQGQREAAAALGLSPARTMRTVILPQAMRVIIPPLGNEVITMLKTTALVSVIAGQDLLTNLQQVYAQNFQVIPLLVVASLWYLALVSVLSVAQSLLEKRFGRGFTAHRATRATLSDAGRTR